jgi:hypothetical protein
MEKSAKRKLWSEEEIKILKKFYNKKGSKYVAKKIGRTPGAVLSKAEILGLYFNGMSQWKKWEDGYMIRHYNDRRKSSIARTLKRTVASVMARAKYLKLRGPNSTRWSEEQTNLFCQLYPDRKYSIEQISEKLNRSVPAIVGKARKLSLSRPRNDNQWTKEQHKYLLENF